MLTMLSLALSPLLCSLFLSFAPLNAHLTGWNSWHRPLLRHFARQRKAEGRSASAPEDHILPDEFRLLLLCVRQYLMLASLLVRWGIVYLKGIEDFRAARKSLRQWGVRLGDPESTIEDEGFFVLDQKGFEPFIRWLVENGRLEAVDAA